MVLHECSHKLGGSFYSSTQVQSSCGCNAWEQHSTLLCLLHFFLLSCVLPQFQLQLTVCNSFYLYNERLSSEPDSSINEMLYALHILTDISFLSRKAPHSNQTSALTASLHVQIHFRSCQQNTRKYISNASKKGIINVASHRVL